MSKNIAEVTSKYGDPESFAERELTIDGAALQKLPIGTKLYAQMEKAPEPVYQTKRIDGVWCEIDEQGYNYNARHGHETRILYTAPPDVAEFQKHIHDDLIAKRVLLSEVESMCGIKRDGDKDACQAFHFEDNIKACISALQKQVQALQAENKILSEQVRNAFSKGFAMGSEDPSYRN